MDFACILQGNGYGSTGGINKLLGVSKLGYGAFAAQLRMLQIVAEAQRITSFIATILKAATGLLGQKDTIISKLRSAGLRARQA